MIFRMRPSLRGPVGWPCASSNSSNRIWMTRSSSRRLFAGRWSSSVFIVSMSLGSGQREAGWIVFPGIEDHGPAVARILHVARHEEERSEEHTSELQSLMRISYAVFCLKKTNE